MRMPSICNILGIRIAHKTCLAPQSCSNIIAERRERSERSEANNRVLFEIPRYLYIYISGELIVSKYVAESITMIAGRFGHEGLCQLRTELTEFCTQLTKAFVAETSCNHCY